MSFTVAAGTSTAFVGARGSGKRAIAACVLGEIRPESGKVTVLGVDPRRERRALRRRLRYSDDGGELRIETDPPTLLRFTEDPGRADRADRIGFLESGRLVLEDAVPRLLSRFRRIRYVNEVTEARTEYGTELDLFDAVRVRVRGWGVDAVVANYEQTLFEQLRSTEGVRDARAESMTLAEIFDAVAGAR